MSESTTPRTDAVRILVNYDQNMSDRFMVDEEDCAAIERDLTAANLQIKYDQECIDRVRTAALEMEQRLSCVVKERDGLVSELHILKTSRQVAMGIQQDRDRLHWEVEDIKRKLAAVTNERDAAVLNAASWERQWDNIVKESAHYCEKWNQSDKERDAALAELRIPRSSRLMSDEMVMQVKYERDILREDVDTLREILASSRRCRDVAERNSGIWMRLFSIGRTTEEVNAAFHRELASIDSLICVPAEAGTSEPSGARQPWTNMVANFEKDDPFGLEATPETDMAWITGSALKGTTQAMIMRNLCRTVERQRNALQRRVAELKEQFSLASTGRDRSISEVHELRSKVEEMAAKRDEAESEKEKSESDLKLSEINLEMSNDALREVRDALGEFDRPFADEGVAALQEALASERRRCNSIESKIPIGIIGTCTAIGTEGGRARLIIHTTEEEIIRAQEEYGSGFYLLKCEVRLVESEIDISIPKRGAK